MPKHGVTPIGDSYAGILAMFSTAIILLPIFAHAITSSFGVGNSSLQSAITLLFQQLLFGMLALWHLRVNLRLAWSAFGVKAISTVQAGQAVLAGLALVALNGVGVWLGKGTAALFFGRSEAVALFNREEAILMGLFRQENSVSTILLLLGVVTVITPLAEELFFRGYLYSALRGKVGKHAIWLSSLLFAAVHFYIVHAIPVFLIAVALTWLYERRGILWESVLAHATLNGVVAIVLLLQRS